MPSAPPCALVIFGASGDLAKRKLLPAVYELAREKLLPEQFALVGYARSEMSDDQFRAEFKQAVEKFARTKPVDPAIVDRLAKAVYYHTGDYGSAEAHAALAKKLEEIDGKHGTAGNRLFYLSTPPETFVPIAENLGKQVAGLGRRADDPGATKSASWRRVIIEKPFGTDLATAKELNTQLHKHFRESQVFRIDHY
ncbi:MAG TPA: hypothetical protein VF796_15970, partial [Humisphaera sp.]